ncbi:hypothetical protein L6452_08047 [Arctium lappa]|uniref:Uncharacterized protein n=1 Tax=Arctium lappa TaxID=4217 RepID=A0ACB9DGT7_ARCLA|nr:hypothetical protein L6452_08047 [Arctium lappa]
MCVPWLFCFRCKVLWYVGYMREENKVIAQNLQKIDPKSDGAKRDWVAIYDECANVLYQEIDYNKEAANAELFARYRVAAKLGKGQSVKSLQGDYVAWKGVVPTVGAGLKSIWDAAVVFLVDGYGDRSHNFSMLSLLLPVVLLFAVVVNLLSVSAVSLPFLLHSPDQICVIIDNGYYIRSTTSMDI